MEQENSWLKYGSDERAAVEKLSRSYREFLDGGKTERECASLAEAAAIKAGYKKLSEVLRNKETLKASDKVYEVYMGKSVVLFNIGSRPIEEGMNILGAHIDSPRLDVKQNPLYEESELAYLDTHYYGGIKKYQWTALPLALHGVVVKTNGETVNINIGEKEDEPVFCVTDLLIHLAGDQMEKKGSKVVEGENLDLLVGSIPIAAEDKEKAKEAVKSGILKILEEKYNIAERDLESAEIEVVPAGRAKDAGLDSSMILSYGQDDRICAYTSLAAFLEVESVSRTAVCLLVDKEEIGSVGATGMRSRFFENTLAEVMNALGSYSELAMRRTLAASRMLSSDVSAAFDPLYASQFDKKNAAYFGKGIVFNKFTGARGKSGSNDANAEYVALVRRIMEKSGVAYQTAELGKVDAGGGGTIAYIMSLYGMNVIDCGMAVLSMHAPWELTSKSDLYEGYKAYKAFISYD